jgi:hypothetical protein
MSNPNLPTADSNVNAEAKKAKGKRKPRPSEYVYESQEAMKAGADAYVKENPEATVKQFSFKFNDKEYFILESNPLQAAGRVLQKLGHEATRLGTNRTRVVVQAPKTAEDFMSAFSTLSDAEKTKLLAAMKKAK